MSFPSNCTLPESGRSSKVIRRAVVVFPDPLSPTSPSISPLRTQNETLSTACTDPASFLPRSLSKNDLSRGKCFFKPVTSSNTSSFIVYSLHWSPPSKNRIRSALSQIPRVLVLLGDRLPSRVHSADGIGNQLWDSR